MSSKRDKPKAEPSSTPMNPGDEAPSGTPGTGEALCGVCSGSGTANGKKCDNCGGTGRINEGIGGA